MSRALMVRSIPLSSTTRNAWKEAGAMFARRDRNQYEVMDIANGRPIINLGNSAMHIHGAWNDAIIVKPLLTPAASRELLGSLMPTNAYLGAGDYWLKGQGRGGANKEKLYVDHLSDHDELKVQASWNEGDVQQHIVGEEYRVITVGHKVVQVSKRYGINGQRSYEWVGVQGAPSNVKEIAREAARLLQSEKTIIGWDVMHAGQDAYILEGNSCPGVNGATANRILDAIEGTGYDM